MLYQIHNFYVEMKYIEKTNAFVELRSFKLTDLLESYISTIDINSILSQVYY